MRTKSAKFFVVVLLAFMVALAFADDTVDTNQERINSIAFNSRELRIINGEPVEMKEDLGSKLLVVFDNLQKDISFTADVISENLDRGWTDFKRVVQETAKKIG